MGRFHYYEYEGKKYTSTEVHAMKLKTDKPAKLSWVQKRLSIGWTVEKILTADPIALQKEAKKRFRAFQISE